MHCPLDVHFKLHDQPINKSSYFLPNTKHNPLSYNEQPIALLNIYSDFSYLCLAGKGKAALTVSDTEDMEEEGGLVENVSVTVDNNSDMNNCHSPTQPQLELE